MKQRTVSVKQGEFPPLPKFADVTYSTRIYNERWLALGWRCTNREHWNLILDAIKKLPERRYNGATKEWIIPFRDEFIRWASVAGFPDPVQEEAAVEAFSNEEWEDPVKKQKALLESVSLDPERILIPGLRPYQIDFLKYMVARQGRVFLGDDMGCIDGDEEVQICRHRGSRKITLKKLFSEFHKPMNKRKCYTNEERPWYIRCLHEDGAIRLGEIADVVDSGMKECVCITLSDGRSLTLTPDHMIKTADGWVQAGSSEGKFVLTNGREVLVKSVEHVGVRHVYDVKVVDHGNFLANKIIVHNCGKTISALAWLVYSDAYPALIVVNAPTKLQWYQQYRDWLSKTPGADQRCQILSGQTPYKLKEGVSCIINWDILHHWKDALAEFGFKYLVGDEVQAIGNPESKRAIAFRMLSKVIPECVCMSGTPARSKPAQFWIVLNIMMPADFPNYYKYLYRYCDPKSTPWGMQFNGASHIQELHYKMTSCLLRRTKEVVMKWLPPKTMEVVPLEIDESLRKEYQEQEENLYKSEASELHQRVAELMRTAYSLKEKSLLRWVRDFLDSGNKLLLFAWHRDVVDLLVTELEEYFPAKIYGGMSVSAREESKQQFILNADCRVMVANIQAGGVGIDGLQKVCNHVAFAEFSHTPLDHRQAEDRLHRSGQDLPVTSYYLVAPGTVDDDSVEVLDDRAQMLDNALDGHKTADVNLIGEILERKGIKL